MEMLCCRVTEGLQVLSFNQIVVDGLQGRIHELQAMQHPTWSVFKEGMKTTYAIKDSSRATRRGFEDWADAPNKALKVLEVFT
jgi:hypothetical protein